MPNWCNTNITFYSNDKKQLQKLYEIIMKRELPKNPNSSKTDIDWIGNILINAHQDFNYEDVINQKYGSTREFIEDISDINTLESRKINYFWINVNDAWVPHIEPFCCLLKKAEYNKIKLAYMVEEPGCEVYEKYDPDSLFYNGEEYIIDAFIPDSKIYLEFPETNDISSEPMNLKILLKIFRVNTYEEAIQKAEYLTNKMQEKYDDGYCYINKIENLKEPY